MPELYIGLMSGTSLDGIDAVLADITGPRARLLAHRSAPFSSQLRTELLALNQRSGDELHRAATAANDVARAYAATIEALLARSDATRQSVKAIGCHGQTVRHQPADGYTIQLVNGALLAELTGLTVVCDFRSRDIAAGGEGAPLVPAFHQAMFADPPVHRAIVNIGGIANITDLPPSGTVMGFDCGPGNLLLDAWTQQHLNKPYDGSGAWAQSGRLLAQLLGQLLADEYFRRTPPKSTGRETFNIQWLRRHLAGDESPADVQATLLALTARSIADAITRFCANAHEVYICGGGARNTALIAALTAELEPRKVATTDALGVAAEHVEALAFAWLAKLTLAGETGNLPSVTGARGTRVLGAIHRA